MYVAGGHQQEIRLTLEVTVELVNALLDGDADVRAVLGDGGFSRSRNASEASLLRVASRLRELSPIVLALPDLDVEAAAELVNERLEDLSISPAIIDHDGVGPHIHWTPATATFDDQVIADVLMALTQELCDDGTTRFGRCGATDCEQLFYDRTRNRSRRFCADPRCASRTHTADHRTRQREESK